jgi:hypothetical protein
LRISLKLQRQQVIVERLFGKIENIPKLQRGTHVIVMIVWKIRDILNSGTHVIVELIVRKLKI